MALLSGLRYVVVVVLGSEVDGSGRFCLLGSVREWRMACVVRAQGEGACRFWRGKSRRLDRPDINFKDHKLKRILIMTVGREHERGLNSYIDYSTKYCSLPQRTTTSCPLVHAAVTLRHYQIASSKRYLTQATVVRSWQALS
jgi:hypothetical protein